MKGIQTCEDCQFLCPNDGLIHQDNVTFLCNNCQSNEVELKGGMYICSKCLTEQESFQCRLCDSKEVTFLQKMSLK